MKSPKGTPGDDELVGGAEADSIDGRSGNDTIQGVEGNDSLYGGAGNDFISTGAGGDLAYGGQGDDTIHDYYTHGGTERLYGGGGDDVIRTFDGGDLDSPTQPTVWRLYGEKGDDLLEGGDGGTAHLDGGSGDDVLIFSSYGGGKGFGGGGDDILLSEDRRIVDDEVRKFGNPNGPGRAVTLDGGTGDDIMVGYSANADTFVFAPGGGHDVVQNFGTARLWGIDSIDLSAFDFEMTAREVYRTYAVEQADRIILDFGRDGDLVILDNEYGPPSHDLRPSDVIAALLL